MIHAKRNIQISMAFLVVLFVTDCSASVVPPTDTPIPPTATPIPPSSTPTVTPTVTPTETPVPSYNAQVTDKDGVQTRVTNLETLIYDDCGLGLVTYVGVPTSTEFFWNFISLNTGEYTVDVPFDIIKKITVQPEKYLYEHTDSITLSDDTVIQGKDDPFANGVKNSPSTLFIGESDLGNFNIDFWNVSEISPLQDPKLSYTASTPGTNQAILTLSNGAQLNLENAAFYSWEINQNGCYQGDERYDSSMGFETTGGSSFQVPWEKIKSIVFERQEYHSEEFKLITLSGEEYVGWANNMAGVEANANFGSFTLKVRIPFSSSAASLTFND